MEEREGSASVRRERRKREAACRDSSPRSARLVARSAHVRVWRAEASRCAPVSPACRALVSGITCVSSRRASRRASRSLVDVLAWLVPAGSTLQQVGRGLDLSK
jgi:hypothetical protein